MSPIRIADDRLSSFLRRQAELFLACPIFDEMSDINDFATDESWIDIGDETAHQWLISMCTSVNPIS